MSSLDRLREIRVRVAKNDLDKQAEWEVFVSVTLVLVYLSFWTTVFFELFWVLQIFFRVIAFSYFFYRINQIREWLNREAENANLGSCEQASPQRTTIPSAATTATTTTTSSSTTTSTSTSITTTDELHDDADDPPQGEGIIFIKKDGSRPGTFKLSRKSTRLLRKHNAEGNFGGGLSRNQGGTVGASFRLVKDGEGSKKIRDKGLFSIMRGQRGGSVLVKNREPGQYPVSRSRSRKTKKSVRYAESTKIDDENSRSCDVSAKTDDVDSKISDVDTDVTDGSPNPPIKKKKRIGLGSFRFKRNKKNASMRKGKEGDSLRLIPEITEDTTRPPSNGSRKVPNGGFNCTDGGVSGEAGPSPLLDMDNNKASDKRGVFKVKGSLKNVEGSPLLLRNVKTSSFRLPGELKTNGSLKGDAKTNSFRLIKDTDANPSLKRDSFSGSCQILENNPESDSLRKKQEASTVSLRPTLNVKTNESVSVSHESGGSRALSHSLKQLEAVDGEQLIENSSSGPVCVLRDTVSPAVSQHGLSDTYMGIRPSSLQCAVAKSQPETMKDILNSASVRPKREEDLHDLSAANREHLIEPQKALVTTAIPGPEDTSVSMGVGSSISTDTKTQPQESLPEAVFKSPSTTTRASSLKEEDFRKRTDSSSSNTSRPHIIRQTSSNKAPLCRRHSIGIQSGPSIRQKSVRQHQNYQPQQVIYQVYQYYGKLVNIAGKGPVMIGESNQMTVGTPGDESSDDDVIERDDDDDDDKRDSVSSDIVFNDYSDEDEFDDYSDEGHKCDSGDDCSDCVEERQADDTAPESTDHSSISDVTSTNRALLFAEAKQKILKAVEDYRHPSPIKPVCRSQSSRSAESRGIRIAIKKSNLSVCDSPRPSISMLTPPLPSTLKAKKTVHQALVEFFTKKPRKRTTSAVM